MKRIFLAFAAVIAAAGLSGCGYNDMAQGDQSIKAAWSEVLNQYQRRSDLIPNLVNTVKGYAAQEQDTLTKVVEARAKATGIQATPELVNDPVAFKNFIAAQGQLQGALSRLLAVAENYPNLKSDALFRDLTAQLEGTENRITVARNRYIKAIQGYTGAMPISDSMVASVLVALWLCVHCPLSLTVLLSALFSLTTASWILSMPASMPWANCACLKYGVMTSRMMRLASTSGSAPSQP